MFKYLFSKKAKENKNKNEKENNGLCKHNWRFKTDIMVEGKYGPWQREQWICTKCRIKEIRNVSF